MQNDKNKTEKIKTFAKKLTAKIIIDDLFSAANDLTYKIFFSLFPFTIFLMSVVGFFKLDADFLTGEISSVLPNAISQLAQTVIKEIITVRSANILSFSLFVSVFTASSGFKTAMRSINKAYGQKDTRKIFIKVLISMILVLIFTVIIIISFIIPIFGGGILNFIEAWFNLDYLDYLNLFNMFIGLRYIISILIMFFSVILINKLALSRKAKIKSLIPGSVFTVFSWMAINALFNFYIEHFSNYPSVYGSITGIIILMLWLNIMCIGLLLGSEINATVEILNK